MSKGDVNKILAEINKSSEDIKVEVNAEMAKLNERIISLEKGTEKSKQLLKDKVENKSESNDPYESITRAWFGKSEDDSDDADSEEKKKEEEEEEEENNP
jgi:ABC-type transporter lipoprotein component MlaA